MNLRISPSHRLTKSIQKRKRSRLLLGISIVSGVLLLVILVTIEVRFRTKRSSTPASTFSRPSSISHVDPKANSNDQSFEVQRPASASEVRNNQTSSPIASIDSVARFSGFTTSDSSLPIISATPENTPEPNQDFTEPLPLVLQSVDPAALKITREQQQIIADLRKSFMEQIAAAKLDPNDPRYVTLWEQIQPQIDQRLRAELGQEFIQQYQRAAKARP